MSWCCGTDSEGEGRAVQGGAYELDYEDCWGC